MIKTELNTKQLDEIKREISKRYKLKVGVLNNGKFKDDNGELTIAGYGYVNEMGSITRNIPQRSFIRSPLQLNLKPEIDKISKKLMETIFVDGDLKQAYEYVGLIAKSVILDAFSNANGGKWAPNRPATIKKKGSSRPLIDIGRLRGSIAYEITEGGK